MERPRLGACSASVRRTLRADPAPDEDSRIFICWRLRHRMTLEQAEEALG